MSSESNAGLRIVRVERPENFDEAIADAVKGGETVWVLIEGAASEAGKSWCPDCEAARPVVNKALEGKTGVLLECPVERSEYKGNPEYPYRTHRQLKLTGVPTLYRWGRRGPVGKLVEEDLVDAEKLVVVGSTNPVKIDACRSAFSKCFPELTFEFVGVAAPSGVSDQPMSDDETRKGAINRAQKCAEIAAGERELAFCVGLEGGVALDHVVHPETGATLGKTLTCFAWMAVWEPRSDKWGFGSTGAFHLPPAVTELVHQGMELGEADDRVFSRTDSKRKDGSVGLLTKGVITRREYYEHALVLALCPFRHADLY